MTRDESKEKSCKTCEHYVLNGQCGISRGIECYKHDYSHYEPKGKEMSLFEKNLEVLKKWNWRFNKESNVEYQYSENNWYPISSVLTLGHLIYDLELRIKPEPQYRPFKDAKEFEPYRDRWVKLKEYKDSIRLKVLRYENEGCILIVKDETIFFCYQNMFNTFTFDNGDIFGILDEVQDDN